VFVTLNSQSTIASDMFDNLKIDMYPNPANDKVTIRFSTLPNEETKISILDMMGRELQSRTAQNATETLDIQDLKSGMYFVKTEISNNVKTQKLIKR
jgi:sulfur transfer protein SufE